MDVDFRKTNLPTSIVDQSFSDWKRLLAPDRSFPTTPRPLERPQLASQQGLCSKRRGRKPTYDRIINQFLVELFEYHGDLCDDDPVWRVQADVEKAVIQNFVDRGIKAPALSTVRRYVADFLANKKSPGLSKGR